MGREKKKILIVDDSEMNRAILSDMLCSDFDIIEAENGEEACAILHKREDEISLMLLDIVMPVMDGFETLSVMEQNGWKHNVPVIMISAETSTNSIEKAYDMGVLDFIARPFDEQIVRRRVLNTLMITAKQKELKTLVANQVYEKEKDNKLMIAVLSHLVEFRNGESGMHVLHIRTITELLLRNLLKRTDKYNIQKKDISVISNAAALHDIGKILIPEEILNKPGRFTDEEFAIMKTHSMKGAEILESLQVNHEEPLIKAAYEICRWHHERYDGRGYPDGLKGDEIPITAQVVAIADVYDALTSVRVYKKAYSHEKAVEMIVNGECGSFNPDLLNIFIQIADEVKKSLCGDSLMDYTQEEVLDTVNDLMYGDDKGVSNRTLNLFEYERKKYKFFAELSKEIQFEYAVNPSVMQFTEWGAKCLGVAETILHPETDEKLLAIIGEGNFNDILAKLKATTAENPVIEHNYQIRLNGELRWYKVIARSMWISDSHDDLQYSGGIGKMIDVTDSINEMNSLHGKAEHDSLTGLLNHAAAKDLMREKLGKENKYVLCLFDLDHFKQANDVYGHLFGDEVLKTVADNLRHIARNDDITARMGGDEYLLFMAYGDIKNIRTQIDRVYSRLCGKYKDFEIKLSMGVSCVADCNNDYDTLFHMADEALYEVKRNGRGSYKLSESPSFKGL